MEILGEPCLRILARVPTRLWNGLKVVLYRRLISACASSANLCCNETSSAMKSIRQEHVSSTQSELHSVSCCDTDSKHGPCHSVRSATYPTERHTPELYPHITHATSQAVFLVSLALATIFHCLQLGPEGLTSVTWMGAKGSTWRTGDVVCDWEPQDL